MERFTLKRKLFTRCKERDFRDDGTNFRGYLYKGILPISVTTWKGDVYFDIRLDYAGVPYEEYKKDYRTIEEFNGVPVSYANRNMDKLEANCEYILEKYGVLFDR